MATTGAYIDLKQVDFFLQDGFLKAGTVTAINAIGVSTVTVTGFTGTIPNGVLLKFAADVTDYSVTASSLTGGNVTSITFTPPLVVATTASQVVTAGPNLIFVKMGEGNLTYDEKVNREYKMDRGRLDQVRNGDEVPMDVNFQFAFIYISSPSGSTTPTFEEFLKQRGPAVNYVSTGADCEPFCVDIVMVNNANALTCGSLSSPKERITLKQFRYESLAHDVKAGTVAATGKCNIREAVTLRY